MTVVGSIRARAAAARIMAASPRLRSARKYAVCAGVLVHVLAHQAGAQIPLETRAVNLAANAAIGAALASARAALRHRFAPSVVARGAAGGLVMSVGKQLAGSRFDGAGLLGRQVHALGLPLVASVPGDTLRMLFPAGPVTVELWPRARDRWRARLDVTESIVLLLVATRGGSRIDWRASAFAGTPVFMLPRDRIPYHDASGLTVEGVVMLADDAGPVARAFLAHELVHVLQWDEYRHLVTLPLERAITRRVGGLRLANGPFDVGLLAPATVALVAASIPYDRHPWEREAFALAGECPCILPRGR